MSDAARVLEHMSVESWSAVGRDMHHVRTHTGDLVRASVREHPLLTLGGGALLVACAMSIGRGRARRDEPPPERRGEHEPSKSGMLAKLARLATSLAQSWIVDAAAVLMASAMPARGALDDETVQPN